MDTDKAGSRNDPISISFCCPTSIILTPEAFCDTYHPSRVFPQQQQYFYSFSVLLPIFYHSDRTYRYFQQGKYNHHHVSAVRGLALLPRILLTSSSLAFFACTRRVFETSVRVRSIVTATAASLKHGDFTFLTYATMKIL